MIAQVEKELIENGISVIKNYVKEPADLALITKEVDHILKKSDEGDYAFGKAARIGSLRENHLAGNTGIVGVFGAPWMHTLASRHMKKDVEFDEMFITHEFRNDQGLGRNGYLHFDRIYTFKFILYLTDCDKSNGAFSCVPGSHINGKYLRSRISDKNKYSEMKNRIFIDYPDLGYTESDVVPIEGPAGTLIVFDTDLFHLGGLVENGKERKLIRLHLR